MTSLNETNFSLETGNASSLNVSLDVSSLGKKSTQCHGTALPLGLQPSSSTAMVCLLTGPFNELILY